MMCVCAYYVCLDIMATRETYKHVIFSSLYFLILIQI